MKIELGCGNNKKIGFYGIDIISGPQVDLMLDITMEPLPFEDNSVEYIYSSHTFEHLSNFTFIFREMFRVCKFDSIIEIWTPYAKSNDGLLFGHHTFFTETSFKHICFEYDRFFLGDSKGYFLWETIHYNLYPNIVKTLKSLNIPLKFALEHMFNIALEWGVFLRVKKNIACAPSPQHPKIIYSYGRDQVIQLDEGG